VPDLTREAAQGGRDSKDRSGSFVRHHACRLLSESTGVRRGAVLAGRALRNLISRLVVTVARSKRRRDKNVVHLWLNDGLGASNYPP